MSKGDAMLDGVMRRLVDPTLGRAGRALAARGATADGLTLAGLALGLGCAICVWLGLDGFALVLLAANRTADGLDGAVARAGRPSDRGGFLDIVCDFMVYAVVPLAFALRDPAANALPSAVLLAAFYANGASFLAFSAIAARRGMETRAHGTKALHYTTGLMEGTETIFFFAAFLLLPSIYPLLAYVFAALCGIGCIARILLGWRVFGVDEQPPAGG
jgi:phosphatidylglycerophosphate synthase